MSASRRIVITTCRRWPNLSASDRALADELEGRGHTVSVLPWNNTPLFGFTSADIVVLRSNWDFHHDLPAFESWLAAIDGSPAELHNPADLVMDHDNKSYLNRLADLGLPTPETMTLDRFDEEALLSWITKHDLPSIVLKPAWGASGHDVERVELAELSNARARWETKPDQRGIIAQEFVPQISEGEFALVFFANRFSHALHRKPSTADFRVNSQYGGTTELATGVDPAAVTLAADALATLPVVPTYARVDIVGSGDSVTLMELEVNEPALGLHLAPGSAGRFADALLSADGFDT